jgi:hypothetical protein
MIDPERQSAGGGVEPDCDDSLKGRLGRLRRRVNTPWIYRVMKWQG